MALPPPELLRCESCDVVLVLKRSGHWGRYVASVKPDHYVECVHTFGRTAARQIGTSPGYLDALEQLAASEQSKP